MSASAGKTWDAVIEIFAERSIPIRTMERASGFIATDELLVNDPSRSFADCGGSDGAWSRAPSADRAIYNVLVRGDSSKSDVRVTARFGLRPSVGYGACETTGRWEEKMEGDIRALAEGHPIAARHEDHDSPSASPAIECASVTRVTRDGDDLRVTVYRMNGFGQCTRRKDCDYRDGALNMSREAALARCLSDAKEQL